MGKRCEEYPPCPYLAEDGSCLIAETLPEGCPRRETPSHENKDGWISDVK